MEDVVAENDQAAGVPAKQLGQPEGLRDAAGFVLHAVGQPAAVVLARAEQLDEIAHVLGARNQQHLVQPGADHLLAAGGRPSETAPTGSRCLLVTLVSSPMRVPLPPARMTMPRMSMMHTSK